MTRKKGEDQQQQSQENLPSQSTRSSKEKGNQAASALSAAAKLERFARTPSQSPAKGSQLPRENTAGWYWRQKELRQNTSSTSR